MTYETPNSSGQPAAWHGGRQRRPGRILWAAVAAALALIIGGGIGWFLFGRSDDQTVASENFASTPSSSAPQAQSAPTSPVATAKATTTPSSSPTVVSTTTRFDPSAYQFHRQASGSWGPFSHVATLHDSTSHAFMEDVAEAYSASGANGAAADLPPIYSTEAERVIDDMKCRPQPDNSVRCRGGRNADILLFP